MTGALALLGGVLAGLGAASLPQRAWLWAAGIVVVAVFLTPLRTRPWLRRFALLLGGMVLACASLLHWQALRMTPATSDARVLLEGTISTVPVRNGLDLGFDAEARIVAGPGSDGRTRHVRLAWREPQRAPRVGERWRLVARLVQAEESKNFTGFDAERSALRDRVHLHARVLPAALNTRLALASDSIDALRARIAARIPDRVADPDAAGLIRALAVGLTDGMSTDQWRVFNATGTTHLVAISGLHVTMFALLAFGCARRLWRWLPSGRWLEREPFAVLSGLAAAGAYTLLSGFSVPAQRTWLMLAVFAAARLAARCVSAGRTWSLALIAVLLLDAFAPLAVGFWLSFVAVGVILLQDATTLQRVAGVRGFVRLQLAVTLVLAPLTFAVFGGVSLAGLAVNLLAIPVISFVFVPLVLAGALAAAWWPLLDGIPFGIAARLYDGLWPGLVWAADFEYAQWRIEPPLWWFLLAVPAALLLLNRWPAALRLSAVAAFLPLLFAPSRMPARGELKVTVLDAGRGTSVLMTTQSHAWLFDTGDSWNSHGTRVPRLVLPALDALALRKLDLLVLPRLDDDRAAGAALLAFERRLERIRVAGDWPGTSLPASPCKDEQMQWDDVTLTIFAGIETRYCVLRVSIAGHAVLLAGELDAAAERELLSRLPARALASDVVITSRPGGSPGPSGQWIEACDVAWVVATGGVAGSDSRERILDRWRATGARVLDTHEVGAVEFGFGTHGVAALRVARSARYPFAWRRGE